MRIATRNRPLRARTKRVARLRLERAAREFDAEATSEVRRGPPRHDDPAASPGGSADRQPRRPPLLAAPSLAARSGTLRITGSRPGIRVASDAVDRGLLVGLPARPPVEAGPGGEPPEVRTVGTDGPHVGVAARGPLEGDAAAGRGPHR